MTRILADTDLLAKLHNIEKPLELCDASGKVLGRLFPAVDLSEYERWEPTISEEELTKSEQATEWYTTSEVLSRLEKL